MGNDKAAGRRASEDELSTDPKPIREEYAEGLNAAVGAVAREKITWPFYSPRIPIGCG